MTVATMTLSLRRPHWMTTPIMLGLAVVGFWLAATFFAGSMSSYDPYEIVARRLQAPRW